MKSNPDRPLKRVLLAFAPDMGYARIGKTSGIFRHLANGADWAVEMPSPRQVVNAAFIRSHLRRGLDGIIVTGSPTADARTLLARCACPVATIQLDIRRTAGIVNVHTDAADLCASVLRTLDGCAQFKSFAYVRSADGAWERTVESRLRRLLAARGISLTALCIPNLRQTGKFKAAICALSKPVAIVADTSSTGKRILDICRAERLSVPNDIAVIATDDSPVLCGSTHPSLSGVKIDFERQGFLAAQGLDRLMHAPGRKTPAHDVMVGVREVVLRGSLPTSSPRTLVQRAADFIRANVQNRLSVPDVARHLHCSRRLLDLRFREHRHRTVLEEITSARLQRTARLLKELPDRSLTEICQASGWKSESRARTLFRRFYGTSMSCYRAARKRPTART